jgi:hypothetical protein
MWAETDDIPPMGDEPEPPPFAVAALLDEESYAAWAPGRVMRPMDRLVADAVQAALWPPPAATPAQARGHDATPSGIGLDCCELSRNLNRHSLRYCWLLGECTECGATDWTTQPRGWHGPVRRPARGAEPEQQQLAGEFTVAIESDPWYPRIQQVVARVGETVVMRETFWTDWERGHWLRHAERIRPDDIE